MLWAPLPHPGAPLHHKLRERAAAVAALMACRPKAAILLPNRISWPGSDAQREAIERFAAAEGLKVIAGSDALGHRPVMGEALAQMKKAKAGLQAGAGHGSSGDTHVLSQDVDRIREGSVE